MPLIATSGSFLAVSIGYLPTIYQTFSKRELTISLVRILFPGAGLNALARQVEIGRVAGERAAPG